MSEIEMVWLDIETTGLDFDNDVILEVGIVLTDRWGAWIDHWSSLVHTPGSYRAVNRMSSFAHEMHVKSELLHDYNSIGNFDEIEAQVVEDAALDWLVDNELDPAKFPACGSTVHFDRNFLRSTLPGLDSWFHYRNIDVSSIKETCRLVNPTLFGKMPPEDKDYAHRVMNCLAGSIREYQWYLENFVFVS